jgi:hypothetical protein
MELIEAITILDRLSIERCGRRLQPIEREIVTIAWDNKHYRDIEIYQEQTVKNKALQLWKALSQWLNIKVKKSNLRQIIEEFSFDRTSSTARMTSLREIPRANFYGRSIELRQLEDWIEIESSRLIFIYGIKGIGKTSIAQKLADNLSTKMEYIVWISLQDAPPLLDVLSSIIKQLGGGKSANLPRDRSRAIERTIDYLHKHRCLLILDNADEVLSHDRRDFTKSSLQDYTQFIDRVNSIDRHSCCVTILTEKFRAQDRNYRQLEVGKLDWRSCQRIIDDHELVGTPNEWDLLSKRSDGNPQDLTIIARTIRDVFDRQIASFLDTNVSSYERVETLLRERLDSLSEQEIDVLISISNQSGRTTLERLKTHIDGRIEADRIAIILDKLTRNSLVEVVSDRFILPKLIADYLNEYKV